MFGGTDLCGIFRVDHHQIVGVEARVTTRFLDEGKGSEKREGLGRY